MEEQQPGPSRAEGMRAPNEGGAPTEEGGPSSRVTPPPPTSSQGDNKAQEGMRAGAETSTPGQPSSIGALPRPPPLTIPASAQPAAVGMSPLPSALALASPGMLNLDSILSGQNHSSLTGSSPGLQTLFNQMAHSTRGGHPLSLEGRQHLMQGSRPLEAGGEPHRVTSSSRLVDLHSSLVTPTLVSPGLHWPDTMRGLNSALGNGGIIELTDGMDEGGVHSKHAQQNGKGGAAVALKADAQDGILSTPSAPNLRRCGMCKGIMFDKGKQMWQLLLLDSGSHQVVGEYSSELEAVVAQEMLSPASGPDGGSLPQNGARQPSGSQPGATTTALHAQNPGSLPSLVSPALPMLMSPTLVSPFGGQPGHNLYAMLGVLPTPRQVGSRGFKGVRFNHDTRRWQAFLTDAQGKHIQLPGEWDNEEEAASVYDAEALKRFGPDTELNLQGDGAMPGSAEQDGMLIDNPYATDRHLGGTGTVGGRGSMDAPLSSFAPHFDRGQILSHKSLTRSGKDPYGYDASHAATHTGAAGAPAGGSGSSAAAVTGAHPERPVGTGRKSGGGKGGVSVKAEPGTSSGRKRSRAHVRDYDDDEYVVPQHREKSSKYRGVSWSEEAGQWHVQAPRDGKQVSVGLYDTQEEAAKAYDLAVLKNGKKERTNFPPSFYKDGGYTGGTGKGSRHSTTKITSQYKGVSWNSACSKWVAVLWDRALKRARHIGSFENEEDAARAYDKEAALMLGKDAGLNFNESYALYVYGGEVPSAHDSTGGAQNKGSSQYRGVSWHERSARWEVRVWGSGKQHFIGSFTSEIEAARAYDKAVLRLRGPDARSRSRMNFPVSDYDIDKIMQEPLPVFGRGSLPGGAPGMYGSSADKPARRTARQPRRRHRDDEMTEDDSELEETEFSEIYDDEVPLRERSARAAATALAQASAAQQSGGQQLANVGGLPGVPGLTGLPGLPGLTATDPNAAATMGGAPFLGLDLSSAAAALAAAQHAHPPTGTATGAQHTSATTNNTNNTAAGAADANAGAGMGAQACGQQQQQQGFVMGGVSTIGGVGTDGVSGGGDVVAALLRQLAGGSGSEAAQTFAQGVPGAHGMQGAQAQQGLLQGLQGMQALQGLQGMQGLEGVQGAQGVQGVHGAQGLGSVQAQQAGGVQGLQAPPSVESGAAVVHDAGTGKWQTVQRETGQVLSVYDREDDAKAATGELLLNQIFAVLGAGAQQQQQQQQQQSQLDFAALLGQVPMFGQAQQGGPVVAQQQQQLPPQQQALPGGALAQQNMAAAEELQNLLSLSASMQQAGHAPLQQQQQQQQQQQASGEGKQGQHS